MNDLKELHLDQVQDALEGHRRKYAPPAPDGMVCIPFAVMAWDEGHYGPAGEFVWSAHHTRKQAEASMALTQSICPQGQLWIAVNYYCPDYMVRHYDEEIRASLYRD